MRRALASRRQFLSNVGRSMLVAGIGYSTARDLGVGIACGDDSGAARLSFGAQERLVSLMQETAPDQLLPRLVSRIQSGTELRELVGAAGLANARAFGGVAERAARAPGAQGAVSEFVAVAGHRQECC